MHNIKKYKLYRSLYDILNPTISRKNISNYNIVVNKDILPMEVYYPKKDININNLIIYIPSSNNTNNLYSDLAINTNNLVIVLNYSDDKDNYYNSIKYIYDNINDIISDNITIMTDQEGSDIEDYIINETYKTHDFRISKAILLEPTIQLNKNTIKNSLVIINQNSNNKKLNDYNLDEIYLNDFFNGNSTIVNERIYNLINNYIGG